MTPRTLSKSALLLGIALGGCSHVQALNPFGSSAGTQAQAPAAPTAPGSVVPSLASGADLSEAVRAAQLQRRSGDLQGATQTLSQLVLIAPDDPRVVAEYGKTLLDKGEVADAVDFLTRAAELAPGDWSVYSALGVAYSQSSNFDAARVAFARALILKPGDATILNNYAMVQIQAGDLNGAERLLMQASQTAPGHARIEQNLALVRRLKASGAVPAPALPIPGADAVAAVPPRAPTPAPAPAAAAPTLTAAPEAPAVQTAAPPPSQAPRAPEPVASAAPTDVTGNTLATPEPVRQNELPVVMSTPIGPSGPISAATPRAAHAGPALTVRLAPGRVTYVQVAAYNTEAKASELVAKLEGLNARVMSADANGQTFYRVRIGPLTNSEVAASTLARVHELGFTDARYVTEAATPPVARPSTPSLRLSETQE